MFTEEKTRDIKTLELDIDLELSLDEAAELAGGYLEYPPKEDNLIYDFRAINKFKKENNIPDLVGLTEEQLAPFVRKRTIPQ